MCNKCKWATYSLCFIDSHLSRLAPATALLCQDPSEGTRYCSHCWCQVPCESCCPRGLHAATHSSRLQVMDLPTFLKLLSAAITQMREPRTKAFVPSPTCDHRNRPSPENILRVQVESKAIAYGGAEILNPYANTSRNNFIHSQKCSIC